MAHDPVFPNDEAVRSPLLDSVLPVVPTLDHVAHFVAILHLGGVRGLGEHHLRPVHVSVATHAHRLVHLVILLVRFPLPIQRVALGIVELARLAVHLGRLRVHLGGFRVNLGRLRVDFRRFGIHLFRLAVHLGRLAVHLGRFTVHFGRLAVNLGRLAVHLGRLPVHFLRLAVHFGRLAVGLGGLAVRSWRFVVALRRLAVHLVARPIVVGSVEVSAYLPPLYSLVPFRFHFHGLLARLFRLRALLGQFVVVLRWQDDRVPGGSTPSSGAVRPSMLGERRGVFAERARRDRALMMTRSPTGARRSLVHGKLAPVRLGYDVAKILRDEAGGRSWRGRGRGRRGRPRGKDSGRGCRADRSRRCSRGRGPRGGRGSPRRAVPRLLRNIFGRN